MKTHALAWYIEIQDADGGRVSAMATLTEVKLVARGRDRADVLATIWTAAGPTEVVVGSDLATGDAQTLRDRVASKLSAQRQADLSSTKDRV